MATLGLKEMGKFFWEGRKKVLPIWLSQFSKTKLPSERNFPISFKPKVAIAKFVWKMQKKVWYYEKLVGRHASLAMFLERSENVTRNLFSDQSNVDDFY